MHRLIFYVMEMQSGSDLHCDQQRKSNQNEVLAVVFFYLEVQGFLIWIV